MYGKWGVIDTSKPFYFFVCEVPNLRMEPGPNLCALLVHDNYLLGVGFSKRNALSVPFHSCHGTDTVFLWEKLPKDKFKKSRELPGISQALSGL